MAFARKIGVSSAIKVFFFFNFLLKNHPVSLPDWVNTKPLHFRIFQILDATDRRIVQCSCSDLTAIGPLFWKWPKSVRKGLTHVQLIRCISMAYNFFYLKIYPSLFFSKQRFSLSSLRRPQFFSFMSYLAPCLNKHFFGWTLKARFRGSRWR